MHDSPYFFMAEVKFDGEDKTRYVYISKYSLPEQGIYSWMTPIARMRFSKIGNAGYQLPSGKFRNGDIMRKDTYIIRQGKVYQVKYESDTTLKTTILEKNWQEKRIFGLTDIIEKLDAYQDDIIRIPPKGSLLISGPAGSGKTTLALHKVAYITQNPETASFYKAKNMTFFVQDESTLAYFASVLPDLGLQQVSITTFSQWAMELLGLNRNDKNTVAFVDEIAHPDYPLLMHAKFQALKSKDTFIYPTDIYSQLEAVYFDFFDEKSYAVYKMQKENRQLDRFDLTLLLLNKLGDIPAKNQKQLIMVDEVENYLPEQLMIIKKFSSNDTNSIMYIGDLEQQTMPYTVKTWQEAGIHFLENRHIKIPKVYRITKQMSNYLISKGYSQEANFELRDGPEVKEFDKIDVERIVQDISNHKLKSQSKDESEIIGLICNDDIILEKIKTAVPKQNNLHILNIHEAQGVEFDTVFLVFHKRLNYNPEWPEELVVELQKAEHDLFMVGATRARNMLNVYVTSETYI
jgi:DNA helicase IV